MKKTTRGMIALLMAFGMILTSACDFLPMGNSSSSVESGSDVESSSSKPIASSSEEDSSSEDPSVNYNLLALQTAYSVLEGDTVTLKVKVLDDGVSLPVED